MKKGFIYKITNKVNGKCYIGQTRYTVEFRWRQHKNSKDDLVLHRAFRKYGIENFLFETIEECNVDKLNEREMYYIAEYNSFKDGYNMTVGGDGNRILELDNSYDEIKRLYLSGFSAYKIANIYGVCKKTVLKLLDQMGIKIRPSKRISINHQEFLELVEDYKKGVSLKKLAKRYDCSDKGLMDYLEKRGIKIRRFHYIYKDEEKMQEIVQRYLQKG